MRSGSDPGASMAGANSQETKYQGYQVSERPAISNPRKTCKGPAGLSPDGAFRDAQGAIGARPNEGPTKSILDLHILSDG